jgi:hypothetical protein
MIGRVMAVRLADASAAAPFAFEAVAEGAEEPDELEDCPAEPFETLVVGEVLAAEVLAELEDKPPDAFPLDEDVVELDTEPAAAEDVAVVPDGAPVGAANWTGNPLAYASVIVIGGLP